jgi:hypothetical protein
MNSNNILGNYINFVNTSQQSLHELIALIRQQDDNFQNLLTRPPNTPVNVNTFSYPNSVLRPRRPNIENRRYNNLDSHSSTNYSYPSTNYTSPFNNLTFTTIPNRILPRQANNENQQINNPTTIEILRATETKKILLIKFVQFLKKNLEIIKKLYKLNIVVIFLIKMLYYVGLILDQHVHIVDMI